MTGAGKGPGAGTSSGHSPSAVSYTHLFRRTGAPRFRAHGSALLRKRRREARPAAERRPRRRSSPPSRPPTGGAGSRSSRPECLCLRTTWPSLPFPSCGARSRDLSLSCRLRPASPRPHAPMKRPSTPPGRWADLPHPRHSTHVPHRVASPFSNMHASCRPRPGAAALTTCRMLAACRAPAVCRALTACRTSWILSTIRLCPLLILCDSRRSSII